MTLSAPPVPLRRTRWRITLIAALTVLSTGSLIAAANGSAAAGGTGRSLFVPGNLLVSGSTYQGSASLITPGVTHLPPGCTSGCVTATEDGSYPGVFNNVLTDGNFGVTSPAFLEQLNPNGHVVNTLPIPAPAPGHGGMVTSFSSKSELALNLSTGLSLHPVPGDRLPDRGQRRHRAAVGTGHRRPAQHHRAGQRRRHGHDMGHHLHRQRRR